MALANKIVWPRRRCDMSRGRQLAQASTKRTKLLLVRPRLVQRLVRWNHDFNSTIFRPTFGRVVACHWLLRPKANRKQVFICDTSLFHQLTVDGQSATLRELQVIVHAPHGVRVTDDTLVLSMLARLISSAHSASIFDALGRSWSESNANIISLGIWAISPVAPSVTPRSFLSSSDDLAVAAADSIDSGVRTESSAATAWGAGRTGHHASIRFDRIGARYHRRRNQISSHPTTDFFNRVGANTDSASNLRGVSASGVSDAMRGGVLPLKTKRCRATW